MNSRNDENLEELFGRFLDGKQAKEAAEDISKGEQILRGYPAPVPNDVLLADIKGKVAKALLEKKANTFKGAVYRVSAVAATFIILATMSVKLFNPKSIASITPQAVWESVDGAAEDAEWAVFTARTEQIENDASSLKSNENGIHDKEVTELESDLTEMDSDFWKG
jgi:hypothetical protein